MYYDLPTEIKNSRCAYLNSANTIYNYPNLRTRQTWIRSGATWYKSGTQSSTSDYNISSYTCMDTSKLEYEYSYIQPIYQGIAFLIAGLGLFLAFYLIIYRLFKGGMKW